MHLITQCCVLFLWIHTLTFVKSQDCTREQFLNSDLYDQNFDTTDLNPSYTSGKQVRVGCNVGYSGFFKLICSKGKWQSRGTKCEPRSCGHPGDAQFADFHLDQGDDFVFGSKVVYTCHKGYQMVSRTNFRRCMAEGWDGVVPVCEAQQCPVIRVNDNVHVNGDPEEATFGNVVRFSCKSNSQILVGSPEIYCDENGDWSAPAPKCKEIKCAVPVIENGYVPGNIQEYKEHEVLHFECLPRYTRTENRPSQCTKVGITAEWSPTPLCEPIRCRLELPPVTGTRFEPAFRNMFSPGDTVRVICGEKYWISNPRDTSAIATCKEDGQWDIRPICYEVVCSNRRDQFVDYWNVYWGQRITLDETVRYRCRPGYKSTDGTNRATCTRDGWIPNPMCKEITCDRLDIHIQNAVVVDVKHEYKIGHQARIVCNEGYKGSPERICTERGWYGTSECTEILCNRKHIPYADTDGNFKHIYRYNEQVTYTCKNGYEGRFTLTCGEGGWRGSPQCQMIQCKNPDIADAYILRNEKEKYDHNERVQYACANDNARRFTITCEQGAWTGIQSCTISGIQCKKPDIADAYILHDEKEKYDHNERVQYACANDNTRRFTITCEQGAWTGIQSCTISGIQCKKPDIADAYILRNEKEEYDHNERVQCACANDNARNFTITCEQGAWTGIQSCTTCPEAVIEHGFAVGPYNDTLYYTCDEGYKFFTKGWWREAKCKDRVWSGLKQCIENTKCGKIPVIPNGKVNTHHDDGVYENGSSVQIVCDNGYRAGVDKLTCGEGQWQSSGLSLKAICKPIAKLCKPPPKIENAVVMNSYEREYLPESTVTYHCRDMYTMKEENTLRCIDGTWEENNIKCTLIQCKKTDIADAYILHNEKEKYDHNERVQYACANDNARHFTITCEQGAWTGIQSCTTPTQEQ